MSLIVFSLLVSTGGSALPFEVFTLSEAGSSRGTAYEASNKIVTVGDLTHVAWLDSVSITQVCTYDNSTGKLGPVVEVGRGHDNHGGPSMCADSQGYLHIVFGPHHHPFQYRRSLRPNDSTEWTPVSTFADKATYPSLVCDSQDTLHVTYRQSGEVWRMMYQRKPKGKTWSEPVELLSVPCKGYTQWGNALCIDKNDRIHLGFHLYAVEKYNAGFGFGYFYSDDHGGTWRTAEDAVVDLPATAETCRPIRMSADMDIRVGNLAAAPSGTVYMTVNSRPEAERVDELWKLEDGAWQSIDIRPFLDPPWDRIASGVVSVAEDGTVYVVTSSGDYGWGVPGHEVYLLVSRDGGQTFDAQAVSTPDPALANWLPNVERNMGHAPVRRPHFVFTHGGPGEKNTNPSTTGIRFVVLGESE